MKDTIRTGDKRCIFLSVDYVSIYRNDHRDLIPERASHSWSEAGLKIR